MFSRSKIAGLAITLTATTAFAGGSGQHSNEAVYHSGEITSHAGAAAASGAGAVVSVPIAAAGSAIVVTGIVLEEVGTSAIGLGQNIGRAV